SHERQRTLGSRTVRRRQGGAHGNCFRRRIERQSTDPRPVERRQHLSDDPRRIRTLLERQRLHQSWITGDSNMWSDARPTLLKLEAVGGRTYLATLAMPEGEQLLEAFSIDQAPNTDLFAVQLSTAMKQLYGPNT